METYVALVRADGTVAHLAFQNEFRNGRGELVQRVGTDAEIENEAQRFSAMWVAAGEPGVVRWRRLSQAEHDMFAQNRVYRDAMEDNNGTLQHNMPRARELHRQHLRHIAGDRLMRLDRRWVDAAADGNRQEQTRVEAERNALRALPSDPRIEAATTLAELQVVVPAPEQP